jgi:hypothetical protein
VYGTRRARLLEKIKHTTPQQASSGELWHVTDTRVNGVPNLVEPLGARRQISRTLSPPPSSAPSPLARRRRRA